MTDLVFVQPPPKPAVPNIYKYFSGTIAAATNTNVWTPASGKAIQLYSVMWKQTVVAKSALNGNTFGDVITEGGQRLDYVWDFSDNPLTIFVVNEILRIHTFFATSTGYEVMLWGIEV